MKRRPRYRRGKLLLVLASVGFCAGAALLSRSFRTPPDPQPAELYAVIYQQVQALHHADFPTAYQQVALETQQKFTLEEFTQLVRTQYPMLVQASRVEFGRVQRQGGQAYIQVFFFTENSVQPCIYQLSSDGRRWRIIGARLLRRVPQSPLLRGVQA